MGARGGTGHVRHGRADPATLIVLVNDYQLRGALRSVGKECFVAYYELFSDESVEAADIVAQLADDRGYRTRATRSRVSNARRIIRAGRARDALSIITRSRVPPHVRAEAKRLNT